MTDTIAKRKPWMKFYPADWQADEGLRQCGLPARGLWIELIAVMHKSPIYGHLLIAGRKPTDAQIAHSVGSDVRLVAKCLEELEAWEVFSRTPEGVIWSRRMVEDQRKAEADVKNGSGGGNPNLKRGKTAPDKPIPPKGVNPPDNHDGNPGDAGEDKAQRLEARSQSSEEEKNIGLTASPSGKPAEPSTTIHDDRQFDLEAAATLRLSPAPTQLELVSATVHRIPDEPQEAVALWNDAVPAMRGSKVDHLTAERRAALRQRLKECGGIEGWKIALGKIQESDWLSGRVPAKGGRKTFRVGIDFVLRPTEFAKIMEGGWGGNEALEINPQDLTGSDMWAAIAEQTKGGHA